MGQSLVLDSVLGRPGVPGTAPGSSDSDQNLSSGLLHWPGPDQRRPAGRPGQHGPSRQRGSGPGRHAAGGLNPGRRGRPGGQPTDHRLDPDAAKLRRGAGQPAVHLCPPAGLCVSAGGRREPGQTASHPFPALPAGVGAARPRRVRTDGRNKRPAPTLFGGVLVFFRGIAALILAASLLVGGNAAEAAEPAGQLLPAAATFIAAFGVGEVLLAWAFFGAETAPGFWPCFSARTPSLFRPPAHSVAAQELTSRQTFWASRWTSSSSSPSPANVPAPMHGIAAGAESHATASPPDRCEPGFNSGGSDGRQQRPVFRCGLRRRRSGGRFRACGRPQGDLTGL